jgi:phage terminase large subunit-like protein
LTLSLARQDWAERLQEGASLVPDGARDLNGPETARARAIFDFLRLPDVPGTPFLAEAAGEWFRDIIGVFLGALDPSTVTEEANGKRLIRELFLLAPKKSSKTSYGAAMMLTALLMNKRPRAEFLLIAPTQSIADLAFSQAVGMVDLDPELRYFEAEDKSASGLHVQQHLRCITRYHRGQHRGQLKVKSFDSSVLTGVRPAGVLLDELHEIAKNAQAASVVGQIRGGLLPIPEAFLAFITTQSDRAPSGVFKSELTMARKIRDGKASGTMLPVLYEFPREIAEDRSEPPRWQDSALWPLVTPNLGRSVTLERLVEEFDTAQEKGVEEVARWASQHLNIQIGTTLLSDHWAGADYWARRADPTITLETLLARCEVVVIGIDDGGMDDLLGLTVIGREKGTQNWLSWSKAWAHQDVFERRKSEAARLRDFEQDGDLVVVSSLFIAADEVADIVEQVHAARLLPGKHGVGQDQYGPRTLVMGALAERGFNIEELVAGVPQSFKQTGAIKDAEVRLADGSFLHADQPLMDWCIGNAKIQQRGNAVLITKQASGVAKIDPLAALINAVVIMSMNPTAGRSDYRGIYSDPVLLAAFAA